MSQPSPFLYRSEPDVITAGVLDAARCTDVCEEVFALLARGDYLMGGANHNSHGLGLVFPTESEFPNMPLAGPDRRFVAMPAYLGGRFDVCGNKWYGSNAANTERGLPRSVLTMMLNDKDTGEPLALMSANLLSSARTGAVPAVACRHLVPPQARVLAVIGCGPINWACFTAIAAALDDLQHVVCYDLVPEHAKAFAERCTRAGLSAVASDDLAETVRDADVVSVAASRREPLRVESEWFKPGVTVLVTGPMQADDTFWSDAQVVWDNVRLHEAYVEEAQAAPDRDAAYAAVIGGPLYRLIDAGRLPPLAEATDLGAVVVGTRQGRRTPEERVVFIASGMAVFDVAWGYDVYRRALAEGIGQRLTLWDEPYRG